MAKCTELTGYLQSLSKHAQHHCCHGLYPCSLCVSLCGGEHESHIPEASLPSKQVLSCMYESPRLDPEDLTRGTILLLLPRFVLKCFTAVIQDKVCFSSCVRASWLKFKSHTIFSLLHCLLFWFGCTSSLSAFLLQWWSPFAFRTQCVAVHTYWKILYTGRGDL